MASDGSEMIVILLILIGGAVAAWFLLNKPVLVEGAACIPTEAQKVLNAKTYSIKSGNCVANTCVSSFKLDSTANKCNRNCSPYSTINDTTDDAIKFDCFKDCYGSDNTLLSENEVLEVNRMICGFSTTDETTTPTTPPTTPTTPPTTPTTPPTTPTTPTTTDETPPTTTPPTTTTTTTPPPPPPPPPPDDGKKIYLASQTFQNGNKCTLDVDLSRDKIFFNEQCPNLPRGGIGKRIKSLKVPYGVSVVIRNTAGNNYTIDGPADIGDMLNVTSSQDFINMSIRKSIQLGDDPSYLDWVELYNDRTFRSGGYEYGKSDRFYDTAKVRCYRDYFTDNLGRDELCRALEYDKYGTWRRLERYTGDEKRVTFGNGKVFIPNGHGYVMLFSYKNYNQGIGEVQEEKLQRLNILGVDDAGKLKDLAKSLTYHRDDKDRGQIQSIILPRGVKVVLTQSGENGGDRIELTGPIAIPDMNILISNGKNVDEDESAVEIYPDDEIKRKNRWKYIAVLRGPVGSNNKLTLFDLPYYFPDDIIFKYNSLFLHMHKITEDDLSSNFTGGVPGDFYTDVIVPPGYSVNLFMAKDYVDEKFVEETWSERTITHDNPQKDHIRENANLGRKIYGMQIRQLG